MTLTGSTAAGREIARRAAGTLKKVLLELGGNDALIVCADADTEEAARAVVLGRLARGNGQICCAVKRVYVQAGVHDAFVDALLAQTAKLTVGDQLLESTDVGPLIAEEAAGRVLDAVRALVADGARLVAGGIRTRAFMDPTVLARRARGPARPSPRRSSGRWRPSPASTTRTRRCGWPTTRRTGCTPQSSPATSPGP